MLGARKKPLYLLIQGVNPLILFAIEEGNTEVTLYKWRKYARAAK